jgi:tricorn protease-like protein
MAGNPDGFQILEKLSKLPSKRIKYIADARPEIIEKINRGIVFLMAFWSTYSVKAFTKLTQTLVNSNAEAIELIVVDVDGAAALDDIPELKGRLTTGAGETAWVRDGKIVSVSLNAESHSVCLESNTFALLSMP